MQEVDQARLASAGRDEGRASPEGCADHGGQCGSECAQHHSPAGGAPGKASSLLLQASRPISRGSLLDDSVAAQHRLEIGICAVERPNGEEILQVTLQFYYTHTSLWLKPPWEDATAVGHITLILGLAACP